MSQEKSIEELEMDLLLQNKLRRRTEDIEYWRKRAGWFDDDVSMKEFNNGVYDTYYQLDDDGMNHRHQITAVDDDGNSSLMTVIKIAAAVVTVGLAILLYRALSRRPSSSSKERSKSKASSSDSKSRSRSKSATRSRSSRSRSRSRRATSSNYELMDDKSDSRSRKSSRSRSRSRRSSSRKSRSRSKSRQANKEVLV